MPSKNVFKKFGSGRLHSGSKHGPVVTNPKQAVAIYMSEKEDEAKGEHEKPERMKKPMRSKR